MGHMAQLTRQLSSMYEAQTPISMQFSAIIMREDQTFHSH